MDNGSEDQQGINIIFFLTFLAKKLTSMDGGGKVLREFIENLYIKINRTLLSKAI